MYRRAQVVIAVALVFAQFAWAQSLRLSVTVEPVLLLLATDETGATTKVHGRTSATLAIGVTKASSLIQIRALASGQASDKGCSLSAKLAGEQSVAVTANQVSLKSDSFALVADLPYSSKEPLQLQVKSASDGKAVATSLVLSCAAK